MNGRLLYGFTPSLQHPTVQAAAHEGPLMLMKMLRGADMDMLGAEWERSATWVELRILHHVIGSAIFSFSTWASLSLFVFLEKC